MSVLLALVCLVCFIICIGSFCILLLSFSKKFEAMAKPAAKTFGISLIIGLITMFIGVRLYGNSNSASSTNNNTTSNTVTSNSETQTKEFNESDYTEVNFDDWNHDVYEKGLKIKVVGTVVQVRSDGNDRIIRVRIEQEDDELFDYNAILAYIPSSSEYDSVIAEDDTVTLYGENEGLVSYETVLGSETTVPALHVDKYEVSY